MPEDELVALAAHAETYSNHPAAVSLKKAHTHSEKCTIANVTEAEEIGGHGIGLEFHEEPWVSYVSRKGTEMLMVPGMVFTIEPMINMGGHEIYIDEEDDWTVYTEDGKPSAQWEVQVLVTEDGYEILAW